MKIAFTGASSTGKTSTARELLSSRLALTPNLRSINVDSRALLRYLHLGVANDISSNEYRVFQTMYISQKILLESAADNYITERSFADCLTYWRIHCSITATQEENNLIERICFRLSSQYDIHFLFPVGFIQLEEDGFRHTDEAYHSQYEKALRSVLSEMGIVPVEMPRWSIIERSNFILDRLNG